MPSFLTAVRSFFHGGVEKLDETKQSEEADLDAGFKTSGIRRTFHRQRQKKVKDRKGHRSSHSQQQNKTSIARSNSFSTPKKHRENQDELHQFPAQTWNAESSFGQHQSNEAILPSNGRKGNSEPLTKIQRKRNFFSLPSRNTSKNIQEISSARSQFHDESGNEMPNNQPSTAVRINTEDFRELSCFHGILSRDAAEALLQQLQSPGSYLIRVSPKNHQRLVLSGETIYHFSMEQRRDGKVQLESSSHRFPNMRSLLDHYSRKPVAKGCTLSTPLLKRIPSDSYDFEISPANLQTKQKIGSGKFGPVLLGYFEPIGHVALKTYTEPTYTGQEMERLWKEIRILKSLRHPNIIRMLGTSSKSGNMTLILEYAELGDLRSYIMRCNKQGEKLGFRNLVELARQVAYGMTYLEEEFIIHRDLAAKNVLLTANLDAKITDFGLAITLQEGESEVVILQDERRPLRWMPLESIVEGRYSSRSDVWAYGVLLWEMFSPGQTPYTGIDDSDIVAHLSSGFHLRCPHTCPEKLAGITAKCWRSDPRSRPSFALIHNSLSRAHE